MQNMTITKDPVCGMNVDPEKAAGHSKYHGQTYSFCSKSCKTKFDADPSRYAKHAEPAASSERSPHCEATSDSKSVVSGGNHSPVAQVRLADPPQPEAPGTIYTCPTH